MSVNESRNSLRPANAAERMTDRIAGAYSSFRPDSYAEYKSGFKRMIGEFTETRVDQAVTQAIDAFPGSFPPTISEIRTYIRREVAERSTCKACQETGGFINVDKYTVKFCDHRAPGVSAKGIAT